MLPPQRKEYAPGDVIGDKYRLLQLLGEGGMGSVWVAENLSLNANVALKLIRADVAESSANERFLSEARLAARLQHAAIVRVFDFGKTANDEPFIVMELLEGETLGQRLTRLGSIDPVELLQTLLPIIDALHSAHGHGVIHRDLKPDNVFIAKAEGGGQQPKLLDFGIAKLRGESAFHTTKLTQAGTLIGSPDYMSPEQARGETDLDPRSDVWALCVLAYECLVGKPPFHGDNYNALLWSIIHDEPVPITVFQAGDSELWRLLKTGFSKNRNGRWDSARKLGEALAVWLENHGVTEDVCNRSLQASWLPAERPTRPELSPFDPTSPPQPPRSMSHAALVPSPTLPTLRRPHTMSLWFAALGLLTLLGALLLSAVGDDSNAALAAPHKATDPQVEKGALRAADRRDPTPPPTSVPKAAPAQNEPIGIASVESNKERDWTDTPEANPNARERPARTRPVNVADPHTSVLDKPPSEDDGSARHPANKPVTKPGAPPQTAPGAPAAAPAHATKPTTPKSARKKSAPADGKQPEEFDFGI